MTDPRQVELSIERRAVVVIEELERQLAEARAEIGRLSTLADELGSANQLLGYKFESEKDIVSRIWVQLGSPTYSELAGRSIYDLIDEMKAEIAHLKEAAAGVRRAALKEAMAACRGWESAIACEAAILALIPPEEVPADAQPSDDGGGK